MLMEFYSKVSDLELRLEESEFGHCLAEDTKKDIYDYVKSLNVDPNDDVYIAMSNTWNRGNVIRVRVNGDVTYIASDPTFRKIQTMGKDGEYISDDPDDDDDESDLVYSML